MSRVPKCLMLVTVCACVMAAGEDKKPSPTFAELLPLSMRDMSSTAGGPYHDAMAKTLIGKLSGVVTSCVHTWRDDGLEPFQAIVVVEADGKVKYIVVNSQSSISKCIQGRLLRASFPQPPFAPYHDRMNFTFK